MVVNGDHHAYVVVVFAKSLKVWMHCRANPYRYVAYNVHASRPLKNLIQC